MSDEPETEAVERAEGSLPFAAPQAPKPRRKPPTRRTPPPPRKRNGGAAGAHGDVPHLSSGEVDRLAVLERELAELKASQGSMRTVAAAPFNPISPQREADPEELTEFQQRLRAQTREVPPDFQREGVSYNHAQRLFCKPDGTIVSLQGDPGNRAYYRDKGFTELSPAQVQEWYGGERQQVAATQRRKADLINTLREQVGRDKDLKDSISAQTELAWDHMSVVELEAFLDEMMSIPDRHGKPRRKLRPPQRLIDADIRKAQADDRKAQAEADRLMHGVETTPSRAAIAEFESSLPNIPRSRTREIEVTPRNARSFA